jgi:putative intracellular protease/amidase
MPSYGVDPSEIAIPWKFLKAKDYKITFITPDGSQGVPDSAMLNGDNLGIWKPLLRARYDAVDACRDMEYSEDFKSPLKYDAVEAGDFDALLLPGGHDKRVREYLESAILQNHVVNFFKQQKPVAAVCHGVVLAARSINAETGKSVVYGYKTTSLLKSQELAAYNMTRLWLKDYYLTYPGLTVEDEVTAALSSPGDYMAGPMPILRDDLKHLNRGFTVKDRNYLSARWPGDIYNFSLEFVKMIEATEQ